MSKTKTFTKLTADKYVKTIIVDGEEQQVPLEEDESPVDMTISYDNEVETITIGTLKARRIELERNVVSFTSGLAEEEALLAIAQKEEDDAIKALNIITTIGK